MNRWCQRHQEEGQFRCDSCDCVKFLCYKCMNESEAYIDILPSKICYFCCTCIHSFKTTKQDSFEKVSEKNKVNIVSENRLKGKNDQKDHLDTVVRQLFPPSQTSISFQYKNNDTSSLDSVREYLSPKHRSSLELKTPYNIDNLGSNKVVEKINAVDNVDVDQVLCDDDTGRTNVMEDPSVAKECTTLIEQSNEKVTSEEELCKTKGNIVCSEYNDVQHKSEKPLYIPEWHQIRLNSGEDPRIIAKDISERCWVPDKLGEEIRSYYPNEQERVFDKALCEISCDAEAFKKKCSELFPVGRIFCSRIQLKQALENFLKAWNCKIASHGSSFVCFYSDRPLAKKYEPTCEPCKRRKTVVSLKKQYKCPFQIRFSLIARKKRQ